VFKWCQNLQFWWNVREVFDFSHKTPKRLPMVSHTIYYHNLMSVLVVAAFISRYGNVKASKFSAYKLLKVWTIQFLTVLISNSRINYWGTGHTWSIEQAYFIFSGTEFSGLIWWFKNQVHFANSNLHEIVFLFPDNNVVSSLWKIQHSMTNRNVIENSRMGRTYYSFQVVREKFVSAK
jgi:hypothetical protein